MQPSTVVLISIFNYLTLFYDVQCQYGPPISSTFGIKFGDKTDSTVSSSPHPINITLFWEQLKFQCTVDTQITADPLGFFSCKTIGNTNTMECDGTNNPTPYGVQIDTPTSPDYMGIDIVKIESVYSSNTITFESDWFHFPPYTRNNYQTYFYLHEDEVQHTKGNIGNKFLVIFNDGSNFQPNYTNTKLLNAMGNEPSISRLESMSTFAVCSTPTKEPSVSPSYNPSMFPSKFPTLYPTNNPSVSPTNIPSKSPANMPTISPTNMPTLSPTNMPSVSPNNIPSVSPTNIPTILPMSTSSNPTLSTINPTSSPSNPTVSTNAPTSKPFHISPTSSPTNIATIAGTNVKPITNDLNSWIIIMLVAVGIVICCLLAIIIGHFVRTRKKKSKTAALTQQELEFQRITSTSVKQQETHETQVEPGVITLESWLNNIGLMQYYNLFEENGFDTKNITKLWDHLTEEDLEEMGITNKEHRTLILQKQKNILDKILQSQINDNQIVENKQLHDSDNSSSEELYDGKNKEQTSDQVVISIPKEKHLNIEKLYSNENNTKATTSIGTKHSGFLEYAANV